MVFVCVVVSWRSRSDQAVCGQTVVPAISQSPDSVGQHTRPKNRECLSSRRWRKQSAVLQDDSRREWQNSGDVVIGMRVLNRRGGLISSCARQFGTTMGRSGYLEFGGRSELMSDVLGQVFWHALQRSTCKRAKVNFAICFKVV